MILIALITFITSCCIFCNGITVGNQYRRITSSAKKHESILYSCFINNGETEVIIHNDKPSHFKSNENIESLHEGLSLSISTFSCYHYIHLNFTFSLQLFDNLYHKDGGIKIYKNGETFDKPNYKKNYRSYLGDVAVFEYKDKSSTPSKVKQGKVSLTFLGNISIFTDENKNDHKDLYKCQSFSAQIWTKDMLYEINPIPTSKSLSRSSLTCKTMTLSAIPMNKINHFSKYSFLNELITNNHYDHHHYQDNKNKNNKRDLLSYTGIINRFDCASWSDQWRHHHAVKIGLIIDQEMYDKVDNDDDILDERLALIFTNTNGLFETQLNVNIQIGHVFVSPNVPNYADSTEWWTDCDLQTAQFTLMKNWNGAKWTHDYYNCTGEGYNIYNISDCPFIDKHAAWILISSCYMGAGIASIGRLCRTGKTSCASANYEREETWMVFAHELGHLFGAGHHFGNGGIMDYGDQTYDGITQFRNSDDICSGISTSRSTATSYKPDCWETYDYSSTEYKWQQMGNYSQCVPACGEYQFKTEDVACIKRILNDAGNETITTVVEDSHCDLALKPTGKFITCEGNDTTVCNTTTVDCGNGLWETHEECDTYLLDTAEVENDCCLNNCTRSKSTACKELKKQIDAAFTDSNGKLWLFQGAQYSVYSGVEDGSSIGSPDAGYPKSILDSFPISTWSGDFDAAFCTSDDIAYIFKGLEYIRVDISAINIATGDAQLDVDPIDIVSRSYDFEFGYLPVQITQCGRIDAAFVHSYDQVTIVCDSIYYSWTIGSVGFEKIYRPFWADYNIDFGDDLENYHIIDAASYNWDDQTIYFYAGDKYIQYQGGQQIDTEISLTAMGYYPVTDPGCLTNHTHNDNCYDLTYLVVIEFESPAWDDEHVINDSIVNITYLTNEGVFDGTNAVLFGNNSKMPIRIHNSNYSSITDWKMSIWLQPTTPNDNQDFFHIIHTNDDHTIMRLENNTQCWNTSAQLTVAVLYNDYHVFQDEDCELPVDINYWNKLTFDATPDLIAVTVNSRVEKQNVVEFEEDETIDLTINLASWHFGTNYIGKMDYFIFQETDGTITYVEDEDDDTVVSACLFPVEFKCISFYLLCKINFILLNKKFVNNWKAMIAGLSVFLAIYTMVLWAFFKFYGARVLLDHIARRLNMEQQVYNAVNADNNNDNERVRADQIEMIENQPQVIEEEAAGMAIQMIENALSGNVTPNFGSPINPNKLRPAKNVSSNRAMFLSPNKRLNTDNLESYDGDVLVSPAKKSPFKMLITKPEH